MCMHFAARFTSWYFVITGSIKITQRVNMEIIVRIAKN